MFATDDLSRNRVSNIIFDSQVARKIRYLVAEQNYATGIFDTILLSNGLESTRTTKLKDEIFGENTQHLARSFDIPIIVMFRFRLEKWKLYP